MITLCRIKSGWQSLAVAATFLTNANVAKAACTDFSGKWQKINCRGSQPGSLFQTMSVEQTGCEMLKISSATTMILDGRKHLWKEITYYTATWDSSKVNLKVLFDSWQGRNGYQQTQVYRNESGVKSIRISHSTFANGIENLLADCMYRSE